jgi:hypothetical protein
VARFFIDRSVIAWSLEGQQWCAHVRGSDVNKGCGKGGVVHDHRKEAPDSGSGIGGSAEGGEGGGSAGQTARDGDSGGARGHGGWIHGGDVGHGVAVARVRGGKERGEG